MEISELLDVQKDVAENIRKLLRNIKKDALERKTAKYIETKKSLILEWSKRFEQNHSILVSRGDMVKEHEYMKKDIYGETSEVIMKIKSLLCSYEEKIREEGEESGSGEAIDSYEELKGRIEDLDEITVPIKEEFVKDMTEVELKDMLEAMTTRMAIIEELKVFAKSVGNGYVNNRQLAVYRSAFCGICKQSGHTVFGCYKLKDEDVKDARLCEGCMSHDVMEKCFSTGACAICRSRQHHSMLHQDQGFVNRGTSGSNWRNRPGSSNTRAVEQNSRPAEQNSRQFGQDSRVFEQNARSLEQNSRPMYRANVNMVGTYNTVLLATAMVHTTAFDGTPKMLRVLCDQGSEAAFCTEEVAQMLSYPREKITAEISGIGDETPKKAYSAINVTLKPRFTSDFELPVSLMVLPKLMSSIPNQDLPKIAAENLSNKIIADPMYYVRGPIDMLLGAKEYSQILQSGMAKIQDGIVAQETRLGWILSGVCSTGTVKDVKIVSMTSRTEEMKQLSKYWELEEITESNDIKEEDKICEKFYDETTRRNEDGGYTPKKLSTQASELTNDILWKEGLVLDGEVDLVYSRPIREFSPDASGFETLLEEEYKAISDVDKAFVKAIPQSVYNHFHHTLYWYKLSTQAIANGTSSREQEQLVNVVNSHDVSVPSGAAAYLAGLGDFEDVTGVKHKLSSIEPNDNGHFGRATAQTHNDYETLPAPAISLQRVLEDVHYTLDRERDPIWDNPAITPQGAAPDDPPPETHGFYDTLPAPAIFYRRVVEDLAASQRGGQPDDGWVDAAIIPHGPGQIPPLLALPAPHAERQVARDEAEAGPDDPENEGGDDFQEAEAEPAPERILPTGNLLGWRPSRTLNPNQIAEISGVVDAAIPNDGLVSQRYRLRREHFEQVGRRLTECKGYKVSNRKPHQAAWFRWLQSKKIATE
ncbi:Uncharacterized protein OBRU01_12359 [Operophtera brumata]|uniref:Uncharacterized protein n=1 Tax=Operophtera brumata TaxID=104452 RepID=A0A0L7LAE6_OPEBR|nr:Uncharacterized protein OBRU01_12359 [Operophtera brumata]